jgi:hypothetical protein
MSSTTHTEDGEDSILTDSEREALEYFRGDDDPEIARIADQLLQSFESTEESI